MAHKHAAIPVNIMYRNKYERNAYAYQGCVFLTQDADKLIYTTCARQHAIQSCETVDFNLPHPLCINLGNVSHQIKDKNVVLEIPTCTLETLHEFYNPNRPSFIRDSDLQTSVVAINGVRTKLAYINPEMFLAQFDDLVRQIKTHPISDWQEYKWFNRTAYDEIEYSNIVHMYEMVVGENPFGYRHMTYPGDAQILKVLHGLHASAKTHGEINVERGDMDFRYAVALFEKQDQKILWQSIPKQIR